MAASPAGSISVEPSDPPLDLRQIESEISETEFAGHLMWFPTVSSTSDLALQAAQAGVRHGVWIADEQTSGRGRGNHTWHSSPGDGIYLSALISPPVPVESALRLSFRTAIAVQSAIVSVTGFKLREEIDIRWPNDLLLNGRKCGGILIETTAAASPVSGPAMLRYGVVGIGINCNHMSFPAELDLVATSLRRERPDPALALKREPLIAAILVALHEEIRLLIRGWRGTNSCPARDLTEFSSWLSGKRVSVDESGGYTGVTAGLNADGFLMVDGDDGVRRTVLSGGVRANTH